MKGKGPSAHAKQVLAFRLRSGLRPLAPPAQQNLFRGASVLHQHKTKRKSSNHPRGGFNESADIPFFPFWEKMSRHLKAFPLS